MEDNTKSLKSTVGGRLRGETSMSGAVAQENRDGSSGGACRCSWILHLNADFGLLGSSRVYSLHNEETTGIKKTL